MTKEDILEKLSYIQHEFLQEPNEINGFSVDKQEKDVEYFIFGLPLVYKKKEEFDQDALYKFLEAILKGFIRNNRVKKIYWRSLPEVIKETDFDTNDTYVQLNMRFNWI